MCFPPKVNEAHCLCIIFSIQAQFGSFDVRLGSGVPRSESQGFCAIEVDIGARPNQQFSVASTNYHDNLDLASGEIAGLS